MQKAKLVKRAEMTVLGTVALALFCSAHVPELLSALDTSVSTDPVTYSASAAAPYVEDSATVPAPIPASIAPTPSDVEPAAADATAASTTETTITVTPIVTPSETSSPTENQ